MTSFPQSYGNTLAESIRKEIVRGHFTPGDHLRLADLAEQFEVSTMPVREALKILQHEGLVVSFPHRGAFVRRYRGEELVDIFEMRAVLEELATRHAIPKLTPARLEAMSEQITLMENADGDVVQIVDANNALHRILYEASGRIHLCEQIMALRNRTSHHLFAYISIMEGMPSAQDEHWAILDSCRSGDVTQATALMYQHVTRIGFQVADYFQHNEKQGGDTAASERTRA